MDYVIVPEPSDDERDAILAALADEAAEEAHTAGLDLDAADEDEDED